MSEPYPQEADAAPFRPVGEMLSALRFLTRVPVPFARTVEHVPLAQAMRMFSVAGALIGAAQGMLLAGLRYLHLPALAAAAIALGFGLFLTGALHEDGLADTADGMIGGQTRERRLEIMRDSRIGTYGTVALIVTLLAKAACFAALIEFPRWEIVALLSATAAFSRAMVVDMVWATRPARSDGLSANAGRPSRNAALFAIVTAGALTLWAAWAIAPVAGVEAMAAALAVTAIVRRKATRLIGGQTGDICGAVQVLAECAMLLVFLSTVH